MSSQPANPARTFQLSGDQLFETDLSGASLDAVSRQLPNGTYTTFRTFGGDRFLRLNAHLHRLEESASLLGQDLHLDGRRVRQALADVLARTDFEESRLRLTVPLAPHPRPDIYITVEPFEGIDPELYATGVRTLTMLIARSAPRAKTTGFITPSRTLKAGLPADVYEVLMVTADGKILEGFTSNFFAFIGSELRTAGSEVLEGITRGVVLELARDLFTVVERPPHVSEIRDFAEAFITSSSRGVLSVVAIDDVTLGDGKPGPRTQQLRQCYEAYVKSAAVSPLEGAAGAAPQ